MRKAVEHRDAVHHASKPAVSSSLERDQLLNAALFSHLSQGMIGVDLNRRIFFVNESAIQLLGYDLGEKMSGNEYASYFMLEDREAVPISREKNPVEIAIATEKPVRITLMDDFYCIRKNAGKFAISLSVSPIVIKEKVQGVVIIFEDVTKEKKVDEIKSDFIYIASHQLRTPLTVSTLHTEMLLGGHGGEITNNQRELLSEIHFYNKKMAELLSVFMTVSKIEMGTFTMQEKPTELLDVIGDILHELNTQIKNKNLHVSVESKGLPSIYTDPEFIRIAFQNLVSNAVKYTPHDGKIRITFNKRGNRIEIAIEDSGCGIPKEEQSQVFTKLYRGTNTKNHRWDSNGLGLYITKSIIDKCRGEISFRSEENKGTTFYVNLPIGQEKPVLMEDSLLT